MGKKRNKLGYSIQRLFESQKSELFSILAFLYFVARVAVQQNLYEYQLNLHSFLFQYLVAVRLLFFGLLIFKSTLGIIYVHYFAWGWRVGLWSLSGPALNLH